MERRHEQRLEMNLPVQVKVASGEIIELELVDIGPSGIKVRGDTLSLFENRPGSNNRQVEFEVRLSGRLAWVEPQADGTLAVGLDLDLGSGNAESEQR